jgi:aminoglycoside phosphotransferase
MPFLMRLSRRIYPRYDGSYHIFRIWKRTVMKSGRHVRLTEATTMRYIAAHTSIPVPKVLDAWALSNGGASILMEWVEGADTLEHRWPLMSDAQKKRVFLQLKGFVDELRALDQPSEKQGWIGPLDGAPLWDDRVKSQPCGPFPSERSFNEFRLSLLDCFLWEEGARKSICDIKDRLRDDHRIFFTHGDLGVRNILVNSQDDVVALIDWEMSGWMPEYWEYIKTVHGRWEDTEWLSYASVITQLYEAEMEIDDQFSIVNGGAPF